MIKKKSLSMDCIIIIREITAVSYIIWGEFKRLIFNKSLQNIFTTVVKNNSVIAELYYTQNALKLRIIIFISYYHLPI